MDAILDVKGKKVSLPKGLAEAADKASIFTADEDDTRIIVELKPGKVALQGTGIYGRYRENRKCNNNGDDKRYALSPARREFVAREYSDCILCDNRLKVVMGKFQYVTVLKVADKKE